MVLVHEDADDITQNTFIKAFKNINNFLNSLLFKKFIDFNQKNNHTFFDFEDSYKMFRLRRAKFPLQKTHFEIPIFHFFRRRRAKFPLNPLRSVAIVNNLAFLLQLFFACGHHNYLHLKI